MAEDGQSEDSTGDGDGDGDGDSVGDGDGDGDGDPVGDGDGDEPTASVPCKQNWPAETCPGPPADHLPIDCQHELLCPTLEIMWTFNGVSSVAEFDADTLLCMLEALRDRTPGRLEILSDGSQGPGGSSIIEILGEGLAQQAQSAFQLDSYFCWSKIHTIKASSDFDDCINGITQPLGCLNYWHEDTVLADSCAGLELVCG